jgi:hypothetical protein
MNWGHSGARCRTPKLSGALIRRLGDLVEDGAGPLVQRLAGLGQGQAAGSAVEQASAQVGLQLGDIAGDIGR